VTGDGVVLVTGDGVVLVTGGAPVKLSPPTLNQHPSRLLNVANM